MTDQGIDWKNRRSLVCRRILYYISTVMPNRIISIKIKLIFKILKMENIFHNFMIGPSSIICRRISITFSICIIFLSALLLQACYSSTAVKGVPVKELVMAEDQRVVKKARTSENQAAIALR